MRTRGPKSKYHKLIDRATKNAYWRARSAGKMISWGEARERATRFGNLCGWSK